MHEGGDTMNFNRLNIKFILHKDFLLRKTGPFLVGVLLVGTIQVQGYEGDIVKPGLQDKCGVCGMLVSKHPEWIAEVIFKDGSYSTFDGSKCMFKYYFDIPRYNSKKTKSDIASLFVTEYYTTTMMPPRDVYFILGSDVLGPMGHEFVPVRGEEAARQFMKDHYGKKILRFNEITPEDITQKTRK
jgi:nitrous oxide reductase accessory protein NosL